MKTPVEVLEELAETIYEYPAIPERVRELLLDIGQSSTAALEVTFLNGRAATKNEISALSAELRTIIKHAANALSMLSALNDETAMP